MRFVRSASSTSGRCRRLKRRGRRGGRWCRRTCRCSVRRFQIRVIRQVLWVRFFVILIFFVFLFAAGTVFLLIGQQFLLGGYVHLGHFNGCTEFLRRRLSLAVRGRSKGVQFSRCQVITGIVHWFVGNLHHMNGFSFRRGCFRLRRQGHILGRDCCLLKAIVTKT